MEKQPSKDADEEGEDNRKLAAPPKQSSSDQGSLVASSSSPGTIANQGIPEAMDQRPNEQENKPKKEPEQKETSVGSPSATAAKAAPEASSGKAPQDGSLPKKPKKDRSNLRKGKWTVEEEEYTSRIIHYFGAGLLTLPEGSTLRSYLADKLNCDPMRITKKYAGASCLGRRAQQFRDRPTPSIAEIQLAKAELDHLEQRFRMRVEEGYSSLPLSPPPDAMFSLSQQANQFLMNAAAGAPHAPPPGFAAPWFLGMGLNPPQQTPLAPALPQGHAGLLQQAQALSELAQLGTALPLLLPNTAPSPAPPMPPPHTSAGIPNVEAAMASLAFAKAAASLAPALQTLAAANLEQQRQMQQQVAKPPPTVLDPMQELSARLQGSRETEKLRAALHAAMTGGAPNHPAPPPPASMMSPQTSVSSPAAHVAQLAAASAQQSRLLSTKEAPQQQQKRKEPPTAEAKPPAAVPAPRQVARGVSQSPSRTAEEQQAGDILIGFLSSLRQSYEEAVKEKRPEEGTPTQQQSSNQGQQRQSSLQDAVDSMNRRQGPRPPQVSDTSSGVSSSAGQPESSLEESDWHSDKKTETSSSEDSDKELNGTSSKGPPRKRLKTKRAADDRHRAATANRKDAGE